MTEGGFDQSSLVDQEMTQVDTLLDHLHIFETDRTHPRVEQARALLQDTLARIKPSLDAKKLVFTIHGSMQYNDPINLDPDLAIVGEQNPPELQTITTQLLPHIISRVWPSVSASVDINDVTTCTIQELEENLYPKDKWTRIQELTPTMACIMLSSMPLYPQDAPKLVPIQDKVKGLMRTNDTLRGKVIRELTHVIATRQQRRSNNP